MAIRVILFEDNETMRQGLSGLFALNTGFDLCGCFENGNGVEELIGIYSPDVVLTDLEMPDTGGIEVIKRIRKINKDVKIIVLTVFDDNQNVFDAICAGANGYILKKHAGSMIFSSIEEVLQGGAPMSISIATRVLQLLAESGSRPDDASSLSPREKEVLSLLVKGNSYKMIASSLQVSIETIKTHIKNIYEKLQVHNQAEAVSKAIKNRLI